MVKNNKLHRVIDNGYCIGCGACVVKDGEIKIIENDFGLYQASISVVSEKESEEVCPFATSLDEDKIGESLYSVDSYYNKTVGFYKKIYSGFVLDSSVRLNSSSGGLATWLLVELLKSGQIDGVIHVGETQNEEALFGYRISTSVDDVQKNSKSRYYPVHFDEVMETIKASDKKYAFVGVPCFVKAVRLLMLNDKVIQERIKFCFAIFCGHFKSKAFAEMIAWQQGVKPNDLAGIDFRVKNYKDSNQYSIQVSKKNINGKLNDLPPVEIRDLFGMDWGLGFFKPKACDWCDDIAGETADIAFGDAWLPEYRHDSGGRNILVVRNIQLLALLEVGLRESRIELIEEKVNKVYESQAGNYRHRQEGLSVRQEVAKKINIWYPVKRINKNNFDVSFERKKLYLHRELIAEKSHELFLEAKKSNSFLLFVIKILPLQFKYYLINKRLLKHTVVYFYQIFKYIFRRKND